MEGIPDTHLTIWSGLFRDPRYFDMLEEELASYKTAIAHPRFRNIRRKRLPMRFGHASMPKVITEMHEVIQRKLKPHFDELDEDYAEIIDTPDHLYWAEQPEKSHSSIVIPIGAPRELQLKQHQRLMGHDRIRSGSVVDMRHPNMRWMCPPTTARSIEKTPHKKTYFVMLRRRKRRTHQ